MKRSILHQLSLDQKCVISDSEYNMLRKSESLRWTWKLGGTPCPKNLPTMWSLQHGVITPKQILPLAMQAVACDPSLMKQKNNWFGGKAGSGTKFSYVCTIFVGLQIKCTSTPCSATVHWHIRGTMLYRSPFSSKLGFKRVFVHTNEPDRSDSDVPATPKVWV